MIAITAYSEPIPVDISPNEPPQIHEKDENEEKSSFAEILAGLMQNGKSENDSSIEQALDALALEKSRDGSKLNLFANAAEGNLDFDSIQGIDDLPANSLLDDGLQFSDLNTNLDIDLTDADIDNVFQNILSAENLFNSTLDDVLSDDTAKLPHELISNKNTNQSSELPSDLSSAEKTAETSDAQLLNAANLAKEADAGKKTRSGNESASPEEADNNDAQTISKNKSGEEKAAHLVKREEGVSKLDEMRKNIRKERVSFEIRDLRTGNIPNNADKGYVLVETAAGRMPGQASVQEITLDLRLPDNGQSAQAQTTWEAKAGNALENMLARELHQNFNGDIVRHASIALRDGGAGTIKIALHPETLGNVKIHLEMTDNKINGLIVVESQEALNAFRKEIAALEQAFREAGFAGASLDLSLTADGAGTDNQELEDNSFLRQIAANNYEGSYEQDSISVVDVFFGQRTGAVNMLA
ncbi:MAG: flagellar hook-length control protein FliK [Treponema sp.]|nr:flagellar hook-length control protein FliK [Treponema sp.]